MNTIPYDKLELSPNNLAHCKSCGVLIPKNCVRIGKQTPYETGEYIIRYYHKQCMPQLIAHLHLEPRYNKRKFDDTWHEAEAIRKQRVMFRRHELRETIRKWRNAESDGKTYMIFDNSTLDDIVDKLPNTKHELLDCYGMGPKRVALYGSFILGAIWRYKRSPHNAIYEPEILCKSDNWDESQVIENNSNGGDNFVKHQQLPPITRSSPQKRLHIAKIQTAQELNSKPHKEAIKEEFSDAATDNDDKPQNINKTLHDASERSISAHQNSDKYESPPDLVSMDILLINDKVANT